MIPASLKTQSQKFTDFRSLYFWQSRERQAVSGFKAIIFLPTSFFPATTRHNIPKDRNYKGSEGAKHLSRIR